MNDAEEIKKFREFMQAEQDCRCFDTFEEFDKCCGKKYGIINPVKTLFKMVDEMCKKSTAPRLKDMEPEQASKTLEKILKVLNEKENI